MVIPKKPDIIGVGAWRRT